MKNLEMKINIICIIVIFLSIFSTIFFIKFNNKIGGNILNEGSEINNDEYYIVNNDGIKTKVTKEVWNTCKKVNIVYFTIVSIGTFSIFYLFCRYIFVPSFKINIQNIIGFFRK